MQAMVEVGVAPATLAAPKAAPVVAPVASALSESRRGSGSGGGGGGGGSMGPLPTCLRPGSSIANATVLRRAGYILRAKQADTTEAATVASAAVDRDEAATAAATEDGSTAYVALAGLVWQLLAAPAVPGGGDGDGGARSCTSSAIRSAARNAGC